MQTTAHLLKRKKALFDGMYRFTQTSCTSCSLSGCACKDTICAHVEEQALKRGHVFPHGTHRLRFIGEGGCVVPPHLRETCTIYLCDGAMRAPTFARDRYARLKRLIERVEWRLMELEEASK